MTIAHRDEEFAGRLRLIEALQAQSAASWKAFDGSAHRVLKFATRSFDVSQIEVRLGSIRGLIHPALCRDFELIADPQRTAITRPWVEGDNGLVLAHAAWPVILTHAIRLAESLHVVHQHAVAHANLKPENIIVQADGGISVVDFALPGFCPADPESRGFACQQNLDISTSSASDDLYSLGALLAFWLTTQWPGKPLAVSERQQWLAQNARDQIKLPQACLHYMAEMMSPQPAQRPPDALAVRDTLDDWLLAWQRADGDGTLVELGDAKPSLAQKVESPPVQATPARLAWTVVAVIAVLLLAGLVYLSRLAPPQPAAPVPLADVAAPAAAVPAQQEAVDLERLLQQRERAEATLDQVINLQLELGERAAERWAAQDLAVVQQLLRSADQPFRQQDFEQADQLYQQALARLLRAAAYAPLVVAEAVRRGVAAVEQGQATAAADAFAFALVIDEDHVLAQSGWQRSQTLDEVLALQQQARAAEAEQDYATALEYYDRVVALDPATEGSVEAVARLQRQIEELAFRKAMSEGLNALREQRWQQARAGFEQAQKLRPQARGPADGLTEVARLYREAQVEQHLSRATQFERREQWAPALRHYQQALQLDANLSFAQQGFARSQRRSDLDQRLSQMLEQPQSWWSATGRERVAQTLEEARAVEAPGPRLVRQVTHLERQLQLAQQPVTVRLISDNVCQVVVYKVARLGTFESTELTLQPGYYTAVATRDGYRDVRKQFLVPAGSDPQPVELRCEEKV